VTLPVHPAATLFPMMDAEALQALADDIREHGQREAVILYHGAVLDGRNRLRACELAGVEPLTCVRDDIASPTTFVLSLNLHRRHLTPAQRAALGVDVSESFAAEAAERARVGNAKGGSAERKSSNEALLDSIAPKQDSDARALTQAAKAVGAGINATERMAAVQRDAPEVFAAVKSGAITTVTDAKTVAALPEEQRTEVLQRVEAGETVKAALPHVAHNSGQNEWYTPAPWIEAARATMGGIDCDPASSAIANERVRATAIWTAEDDGRERVWGERVWMNPPYAQPLVADFCEALAVRFERGEVKQACVLVNNGTETAWFHRLLSVASAVCFPRTRVRFLAPSGEPSGSPLQGQACVYLGSNREAFTKYFSAFGVVLVTP
jgi:ParB family chromosome partitioning protein